MTKTQKLKPYDLEERTFQFAKTVRNFVKTLPNTIWRLYLEIFLQFVFCNLLFRFYSNRVR